MSVKYFYVVCFGEATLASVSTDVMSHMSQVNHFIMVFRKSLTSG